MTRDNPTLLDLFCGAGGLSFGFLQAGFSVVAAVDCSPIAIETYSRNLGTHAEIVDLTKDFNLPGSTVIAGGPPCQGFSSAGMRRLGDDRNSLVSRFAAIVSKLQPRAFVFENVEAFLTAENGAHVLELLTPLLAIGYQIHLRKINAANYGVPQHRKRVIAIGGLGWQPPFPEATYTAFGAPGALLASHHLPLTPTVEQVLADLPHPASDPPGIPQGHYSRPLVGLELERARTLKPGETMRDLPEDLKHESYKRRAYRRVMDGTPAEKRGGAPAGIRRLKGDQPSKAITGGACSEFLHPVEHRTLTVRESARLQTFPDDFVFLGTPGEQIQLVGNAVPPKLATILAASLMKGLREARHPTRTGGAILSFIPSLADGHSPVLKHVVSTIQRKFGAYFEKEELPLWR